jgi:hypothetical protein
MFEIPAPALLAFPGWWAGGGCAGRHTQKEKTVTTMMSCSNVAGLVALGERVDSLVVARANWWDVPT